jgi:cytoskeletal protein RodZ
MSDTTDLNSDVPLQNDNHADRVGDIIRKERLARQISPEIIAQDLRLNVAFLKALEAGNYDALPSDPYIRVYLRALAKYLMLDPEMLIKKFCNERGISPEPASNDTKLVITMVDKERTPSKPWIIIIAVIAVLIIVGIIGGKAIKGLSSGPEQSTQSVPVATETTAVKTDDAADSLGSALSRYPGDALAAKKDTSVKAAAPVDTAAMVLSIHSTKDSVWVQIYCDGKPRNTILQANTTKYFSARDSFNVNAGKRLHLAYTLNKKPLTIKATEAAIFTIVRNNPEPTVLTYAQWALAFKKR